MMKPFRMLNIPVMLPGLGAALILSPACKAQWEVAPDHFDGSDSWAAPKAAPQKVTASKLNQMPPVSQALNHQTPSSSATLQLAAKRDSSLPGQPGAAAIQDKRKPTARKPKKP
jgi:hypothetical protein